MSRRRFTSPETKAPAGRSRAPESEGRQVQELSLLHEVSRVLDQSLELRAVVPAVLEALASHMNLYHGTLTLLNRTTGQIIIDAAHGITPQQLQRGRYRLGEGVTGKVVLSGEPSIIPRTSESPIFLDRTQRGRRDDVSFLCVPIKHGKEVYGALSVDRAFNPSHDLEDDVRLLSIVASMIAQAVRLRREAEERRLTLLEENERLRAELQDRFRPSNLVGRAHEMEEIYRQVATVSQSSTSVLISGETGTGKELVAQAIHYNSPRAAKPLVKVHCAALPETLIESELFGHVRGAFTGAQQERKGRFELAHGGTIFLDEVAEIPPSMQIMMLRVVQERELERLGDNRTI